MTWTYCGRLSDYEGLLGIRMHRRSVEVGLVVLSKFLGYAINRSVDVMDKQNSGDNSTMVFNLQSDSYIIKIQSVEIVIGGELNSQI